MENPTIPTDTENNAFSGIETNPATTNPFEAERKASEAQVAAEKAANDTRSVLLQTTLAAVKIDRKREKKANKFAPSVLNQTYSDITMEQFPDGNLSPADQTRHRLSIAMGYTHTKNTENVALCAVKLPVGITAGQLEKALRDLVGEDNFITKDYFNTSNSDMKTQFRTTVESLRFVGTFSECGMAASNAPYNDYVEEAISTMRQEEESLA
jgi:ribosomal protein S5